MMAVSPQKCRSTAVCRPVYVMAGKDPSLVAAECERLLGQLVKPAHRATSVTVVDGDQAELADVLDELRTVPFLAERRVVVIRAADGFVTKYRKLLETYFDAPCTTGTLVLAVSTWSPGTILARKLKSAGELVSVAQPNSRQLPTLVAEYARQKWGKSIGSAAVQMLVQMAGDGLTQLYCHVDKLAAYAGDESQITADHVSNLVGRDRIGDAFEVIDAATAGNAGRAIEILRSMLADDKGAGYQFIGAIAYAARRLFRAKRMQLDGHNQAAIASALRVWSDRDAFFRRVGSVSLEWIGRLLKLVAEADIAIKTGRSAPLPAAERLVLLLADVRVRQGNRS